ncbi:Beta-ketoacyl synthase [Macrophomina phaseolina MS6]|uniref:Beta-ketoacyl synthase n=1 Tax=Macrophomina phaseolina (strain MS6) TaxID=1126212 RepID=K2R7R1_MACPH|nr:Beta-ketoacyl synthase [Macrophomina phaseolina MS6]
MSPGQASNYGDKVEPIAIVGMAARFPGDASSVETFWDMIVQGRSGHSKVPSDRFDAEAWYHPNHERRGAIQPRSGFFIDEDPATFDAPFFSITAKEAAGMDPMQRKLLEVAYEAFENVSAIAEPSRSRTAGIPMESLPRSQTGVYTGVMTYDYELMTAGDPMHLPQNPASGTSRAMLSNRISWFFDLRGPSFSLDTACSSSLYALHLACQSLRLGETTQALVTGTNMILAPNFISQLSSMHMLSPDGISHSFDARANGYARGEAVAGIVVKTLRKALEDGDTIRAVIRGTGANQDGKTPGITMPSGEAQAALIRSTYEAAGLDMHDTCYFEAHGTGTSLGDPIELGAIGASFGADRSPDRPLIVGSVKTNVGHTEGTAGLAGVIKAVLALERGIIPPVAGFERLNPKLRLEEWKLKLPLEATPWPTSGLRRASVNSFGFGGANAHVILDDARHYLQSRGLAGNHRTIVEDGESSDSALSVSDKSSDAGLVETKLFVFSAFDREGVQRLGASYANFLGQKEQAATISPDDLAYTLAARRTQFDFRSFAVASSLEALRERMQALPKLNRAGRNNNPIFVFTGQGAQWPAMGCELLENTVFRQSIERSQSTLDKLGAGWRVADLLSDPTDKRIDLPTFSQPVCTILQLALVDLLRSWGVRPRATVGHSSGEVAAAYGADLIRHEDAVKIGFWRGFYSEEVKKRVGEGRGAMMAAGVSEDEAQKFLGRLPPGSMAVVGCVNSPSSVTLSGDVEAIDQLERMLQQEGRFARKLRVQVAYHSPHMRTVADDFVAAVGEVTTQQSDIVMFSSVTEERIDDPTVLGARYWMRNLISAVRFSGALTNMLDYAPQPSGRTSRRRTRVPWSALVEVGPHEALKGPCRQILAAWDAQAPERIPYASILTRGKHAGETAKAAAGLLWAVGHPVDLLRVNKDDEQHRNLAVLPSLPPYPWNHSKGFWHEPPASASARLRTVPRTDLLGVPVPNQNPMEPCWRNFLRVSECPWQEDHVITGTVLYPAAGMLIMAIEAAKQLAVPARALHGIEFRDVRFDKGLVIPAGDQGIETFLSVRPHPVLPDVFHYTVFSTSAAHKWTRHSWGSFAILYDDGVDKAASTAEWQQQTKTLEAIKSQAVKKINVDAFYDQLQAIGTEYGPTFRNVVEAAATPEKHQGWGTIAIPDTRSTMPHEYETPHLIHPATLDAIFHLIFVAMGQGEPLTESAIPTSIESMFVSASQPSGVGSKFLGFASASSLSARDTRGDMVVSDVSWTSPKIVVKGMVVTEVSSGASGTNQALPATAPKRAARLTWKEDVDTLSGVQASTLLTSKAQNLPNDLSKAGSLLATWLDLACFKHADLEVLLLDGPGWDDSVGLLKRFAPVKDQRFRFARCAVVTKDQDAASGFENSLADAQLNVSFATPDKTEELGEFDLVLAPPSNNIPLSQARSLLRPGGKIALSSTGGGKSTLDKEISDAGLRELISIDDHDGTTLVIVETDAVMEPDVETTEVTLLHRESRSPTATAFEDHLSKELSALGIRVTAADLSRVEELTGKAVISLLEIEEPFVIGWDEHQFEQFRKLTAARYLLWITHGGILEAGEASLSFAPTTGLLRTVRIEKPQICLPHLDLSPATELTSERAVELTIATLRSSTRALVKGKKNEMELAESGGVLYIPRAEADDGVDTDMELSSGNVRSVPGPLYSRSSTGRKLEARRAGQIDTVRWVEDGDAKRSLEAGEVEIKVSYVALNEPDIRAFTSGAAVPVFGREVVGTVAKIGAGVTRFRPGDRVFALHQAELRTHVRKSQEHVRPVPPSLPSEAAAALPLSLGAAWHILTDRARLQQGESLLIDGATGSLGLALVQVAKFLQARIYASVDSDTAKDVLVTRHGMSAESIFDSRSSSLSSSVLLQTGGKGVDVVISASTGAALRSFSSCVGDDGRFVDVSQRADPAAFDPRFFKRSVSLSSVYVGSLGDDKLYSLTETVLARMGDQATPKTRVYSVSALPNAAADAQSGQFQERTVLELSKDAVVPLLPSPPPRLELDPEGTYVLAGGLGVLGLIIAEHMVAHGARHLLFLSRSGASTRKQQDTLESFRSRGCVADAIKCDVTDASQVAQVARTIRENQWKLKGVVQLAMVLRDSIFENMTYDKWRTAIDPKVKGTWNLHSLVLAPQEDTVDFFIILSSMSGIIGNTAQANYAAGNTYEDAVALHRHRALGLAATTLNVGLVTDVDHFNEDSTVEDYLKKYSHWIPAQLTHRELLVAIEAVMRGATADGRPVEDQLLVGINDEVPRDGLNLWPQDRKFDHRISTSAAASGAGGAKDASLALKLRAVQTLREAAALAEEALRINVANALTASPGDIDVEKPLYSLGGMFQPFPPSKRVRVYCVHDTDFLFAQSTPSKPSRFVTGYSTS